MSPPAPALTPQDLAWNAAVDRYLDEAVGNDSTRHAYHDALYAARRLESRLDLSELNPRHLAAWRRQVMRLPLSIGSKRQRIAAMRGLMRWTFAMGLHELPWERAAKVLALPPNAVENARQALSEESTRRLLHVARSHGDEALVAVMVAAGLRVTEVANLDVRDLRLEAIPFLRVRHGSGGQSRAVPLLPEVAAILERHVAHRRSDMPMFMTRGGRRGRIHAPGIRERVALLGAEAGLGHLTPHQLRHTCRIRCLQGGANLRAVAKLLGYRDTRATQPCLHDIGLAELAGALAPWPEPS